MTTLRDFLLKRELKKFLSDPHSKEADQILDAHGHHIQSLHLDLSQLNSENLKRLFQLCPNIKHLTLKKKNLTNNLFQNLILHLKVLKLSQINLSCCRILTPISIIAIKELKNLHQLNLMGCIELTDASLITIVEELKNLTCLNLSRCKNLTNISIIAIAKKLEKLIHLNLSFLEKLTDISILEMTKERKNLTRLKLSYGEFTDASIIEVKNLKSLTDLDLSYCENLTLASLR